MGPVARSPLLGSGAKVSRCAGPPMVCAEDVVPPPDVLGRALAQVRGAARFFFPGGTTVVGGTAWRGHSLRAGEHTV